MATLIAHSLSGAICLSLVALLRPQSRVELTPATLVLCAAAGCVPDFDIASSYVATGSLTHLHSGPTHSLAFALLIGTALYLALKRTAARLELAFAAGLSTASHVLIDYCTGPHLGFSRTYGVPLLWPFTLERYALPFTLFRGVQHGSVAKWFTWPNLQVALIEFVLFLPVTVVILVLGRRALLSSASVLDSNS
jgi:membrane-bound metal-dependent hydrolase YbcI (DUF457 family)